MMGPQGGGERGPSPPRRGKKNDEWLIQKQHKRRTKRVDEKRLLTHEWGGISGEFENPGTPLQNYLSFQTRRRYGRGLSIRRDKKNERKGKRGQKPDRRESGEIGPKVTKREQNVKPP